MFTKSKPIPVVVPEPVLNTAQKKVLVDLFAKSGDWKDYNREVIKAGACYSEISVKTVFDILVSIDNFIQTIMKSESPPETITALKIAVNAEFNLGKIALDYITDMAVKWLNGVGTGTWDEFVANFIEE